MNPALIKLLVFLGAAALVYFSDGKIDFDHAMIFMSGLGLGGAFVPRPGDAKPVRLGPNGFPLSVLALAFLCGCLPGGQKVDWPKLVRCGSTSYDAAPTVTRILLEDGLNGMSDVAKRELTDVALKFGADTVSCLVQELVTQWRTPGSAKAPETLAAADRGEAFLKEHGVELVQLE